MLVINLIFPFVGSSNPTQHETWFARSESGAAIALSAPFHSLQQLDSIVDRFKLQTDTQTETACNTMAGRDGRSLCCCN